MTWRTFATPTRFLVTNITRRRKKSFFLCSKKVNAHWLPFKVRLILKTALIYRLKPQQLAKSLKRLKASYAYKKKPWIWRINSIWPVFNRRIRSNVWVLVRSKISPWQIIMQPCPRRLRSAHKRLPQRRRHLIEHKKKICNLVIKLSASLCRRRCRNLRLIKATLTGPLLNLSATSKMRWLNVAWT